MGKAHRRSSTRTNLLPTYPSILRKSGPQKVTNTFLWSSDRTRKVAFAKQYPRTKRVVAVEFLRRVLKKLTC